MPPLSQQHCLNHSAREAVAQCPQCHHYFCRECITEHDDRILCAACLREISRSAGHRRRPLRALGRVGASVAGFMTAALFFHWLGQILLLIPTPFHDGTLWTAMWNSWRQ